MRFKVWTGPTTVSAVADALKLVPGVSYVLEGTEHVYFTSDIEHFDQLLDRAKTVPASRPCWAYIRFGR